MNPGKILIAPDSFKGTLTAKEVTDIIADEVSKAFPACEIIKMPISDGGEGSTDAILSAIGGKIYEATVLSPDEREITARFGITTNSIAGSGIVARSAVENDVAGSNVIGSGCGTAILEMAQSSGITRQTGLHPMTSTTYGFGQLILSALDKGARNFNLCIGGSATTDGGCGMAAALGVRYFDKKGDYFIPCGETLCDIIDIDINSIDERIAISDFTVMCDVDNPLYGANGAAYIYGPQKGANPEQIKILDDGLRHYGAILSGRFKRDFCEIPGAGAAGGLGAGCMAYLDANLQSGIDAILKLYDFKKHCMDTDLIITGEGKLDSQSFQGKVLSGIMNAAGDIVGNAAGDIIGNTAGSIPILAICGTCDCDAKTLQEKNLIVFEASDGITNEKCMNDPVKYLRIATKKALQSIGIN